MYSLQEEYDLIISYIRENNYERCFSLKINAYDDEYYFECSYRKSEDAYLPKDTSIKACWIGGSCITDENYDPSLEGSCSHANKVIERIIRSGFGDSVDAVSMRREFQLCHDRPSLIPKTPDWVNGKLRYYEHPPVNKTEEEMRFRHIARTYGLTYKPLSQ